MEIFNNRNEMFQTFDENLIIAELGVFEGDFSKEINNICKPKKLYLIDLFSGYFGSGDKDGKNHHYVRLDDEYLRLKTYFNGKNNIEIIKSSTFDFLNKTPNDLLDIVYIDADHSYLAVKSDLELSFLKVKNGGYICGHDYVDNTDVKRAVDDFCYEKKLTIKYLTMDGCPSYCIQK